MIKIVSMLKRKEGISLQQFSDHWFKHGPLSLREIPQDIQAICRRYAQNHAIMLGEGAEPAFDGIAESCFDDLKGVRKWSDFYFSDAGKVLREDEENFMDKSKRIIVVTEEKVIIP